jgi:hypothetical protein
MIALSLVCFSGKINASETEDLKKQFDAERNQIKENAEQENRKEADKYNTQVLDAKERFKAELEPVIEEFIGKIQKKDIRGKVVIHPLECAEGISETVCVGILNMVVLGLTRIPELKFLVSDRERESIIEGLKKTVESCAFYKNCGTDRFGKQELPDLEFRGSCKWSKKSQSLAVSMDLIRSITGVKEAIASRNDIVYSPYEDANAWEEKKLALGKILEKEKESLNRIDEKEKRVFKEIEENKRREEEEELRNKIIIFISILAGAVLILLILRKIRRSRMRNAIMTNLPGLINEAEVLIRNARYVAASKQIEKVLRYDTENAYFHDLKTQLETLTQGEPELAEKRAILLHQANEKMEQGRYDEAREICEGNPEILANMQRAKAIAEKAESLKIVDEKTKVVQSRLCEIRKDMESNHVDLHLIRNEVSEMVSRFPALSGAGQLLGEIEQEIARKNEIRNEIIELLDQGKACECLAKIRNLKQSDKSSKILSIESAFSKLAGKKHHVLQIEGIGLPVHVFVCPEITVGRHGENDFVIDNAAVSRKHAVFGYDGNGVFIKNLAKLNGTFADGSPVPIDQPHYMNSNQKINFAGMVDFDFSISTEKGKLQCACLKNENVIIVLLKEELPSSVLKSGMQFDIVAREGFLFLRKAGTDKLELVDDSKKLRTP